MTYVLDIVGTLLAIGFFARSKDKHWENIKAAATKNNRRPDPQHVQIRLVQQAKKQEPEELPPNVIKIERSKRPVGKEKYKKLPCSICGAHPGEPCRPGCFVGLK